MALSMKAHAGCRCRGAASVPRALMRSARSTRMAGSVHASATETDTQQPTQTRVVIKGQGVATLKGSIRKVNEDRYDVQVPQGAQPGQPSAFVAVYDGHGGSATADWLKAKFFGVVQKFWRGGDFAKEVTTEAYLQADKQLLTPQSGFLGMGERGVGGSKCGATAASVLLFTDKASNTTRMVTANIGDARVILVRDGKPEQLTVDHVPDDPEERKRIERFNPNPKMPLVRYIGGTWRTGGLLALSRAFGDAYLKGSLQFEGIPEGSDGYSSGFGVIAEPHITLTELTAGDTWIVVSSDGLYNEETRGGGGGLDNQQVVEMLAAAGANADCNTIAQELARTAVELGSTDDVTLVVLKLGPA